jgi:lactase-phlorizin hydrolase
MFVLLSPTVSPNQHRTKAGWLKVNPWGLRYILNWVKDHWGNFPIYITESGRPDEADVLNDINRIYYYRNYTNEVLKGNEKKNIIYM